ncbi:unnamed protein product [Protopolystoma xenopodis]|uniref:Uncharacterized protein n=1 Tax=Protopolystoma xenopodis TaxID=117903 RepID=A0A448WP34_9PLAT|nr:unnamed protein product [Protopolystoma xenopodis]
MDLERQQGLFFNTTGKTNSLSGGDGRRVKKPTSPFTLPVKSALKTTVSMPPSQRPQFVLMRSPEGSQLPSLLGPAEDATFNTGSSSQGGSLSQCSSCTYSPDQLLFNSIYCSDLVAITDEEETIDQMTIAPTTPVSRSIPTGCASTMTQKLNTPKTTTCPKGDSDSSAPLEASLSQSGRKSLLLLPCVKSPRQQVSGQARRDNGRHAFCPPYLSFTLQQTGRAEQARVRFQEPEEESRETADTKDPAKSERQAGWSANSSPRLVRAADDHVLLTGLKCDPTADPFDPAVGLADSRLGRPDGNSVDRPATQLPTRQMLFNCLDPSSLPTGAATRNEETVSFCLPLKTPPAVHMTTNCGAIPSDHPRRVGVESESLFQLSANKRKPVLWNAVGWDKTEGGEMGNCLKQLLANSDAQGSLRRLSNPSRQSATVTRSAHLSVLGSTLDDVAAVSPITSFLLPSLSIPMSRRQTKQQQSFQHQST